MKKLFRFLVLILPAALYFSYFPLIHFGEDASMNFEISLPLIWLVLFDITVLIMAAGKKEFWQGILKHWPWLLLPVWLSLSVIWSLNLTRGLLTAGILWLIYLAIYGFYFLRELFDLKFRVKFWKVFYGSTFVVCAWCFLQCILDLAGIGREFTLMCAGCTYSMFGFPHPNGFAIEPQFMGNLLLAPVITLIYFILKDDSDSTFQGRDTRARLHEARALILDSDLRKPFKVLLLFVFLATLFLTFSRGAIYAFVVAMVFMSVFMIVREKKKTRAEIARRVGLVCGIIVIAFVFILNLQGVMAASSPTNDTYHDGVSKVLNHLSLGIIDIRSEKKIDSNSSSNQSAESVSETIESSAKQDNTREAAFDGYVAESTDARIYLSNAAIMSWQKNFVTMMFGVGLGGAGQAIHENEFTLTPKEIVQNQYVSLLLETGVIGVLLLVFTMCLVLQLVWKKSLLSVPMLLALMIAYGVSLCFFAGLPNALQIYLLFGLLVVFCLDDKPVRLKCLFRV